MIKTLPQKQADDVRNAPRPAFDFGPAAAALAAACAAFAVFLFWRHAGGLWRDEVNSVNFFQRPTYGWMWHHLDWESFPLLWMTVGRGWAALFGTSDATVRAIGALTGLGLIAAIWGSARWCGYTPALALALIAVNPVLLRLSASNRAYGLAIILDVIAYHAIWRMAQAPTRRRVVAAALVALAATQTLYPDIVYITAMLLGACAVAWGRGDRAALWTFAAIEGLCGLSLTLYLPIIHQQHAWSFLAARTMSLHEIITYTSQALHLRSLHQGFGRGEMQAVLMHAVWLTLLGLGFGALVTLAGARRAASLETERQDVVRYAAVTVSVAVAGIVCFLAILSYGLSPWYLAAIVTLVAVGANHLLTGLRPGWVVRAAVPVVALLVLAADYHDTIRLMEERQTNVDLAAGVVNAQAQAGDLILLTPYYYGQPFARYYHGSTAWTTAPPLPQYQYGGPNYLAELMLHPAADMDRLTEIQAALKSGHAVWVVGQPLPDAATSLPPILPPNTRVNYGVWVDRMAEREGYLLSRHSREHRRVPVPDRGPVWQVEVASITRYSGWANPVPRPNAAPPPGRPATPTTP